MEREIQTLKELLAQIISPEAKGDPNLALVEVIFHINFLSFGDKGFSPAYKHWACLPWESLPLVRWKNSISPQWQLPAPEWPKGPYACIFPQSTTTPIQMPSRCSSWYGPRNVAQGRSYRQVSYISVTFYIFVLLFALHSVEDLWVLVPLPHILLPMRIDSPISSFVYF